MVADSLLHLGLVIRWDGPLEGRLGKLAPGQRFDLALRLGRFVRSHVDLPLAWQVLFFAATPGSGGRAGSLAPLQTARRLTRESSVTINGTTLTSQVFVVGG